MYTWNLKSLYKGLDDLKFSSDQNKLDKKY